MSGFTLCLGFNGDAEEAVAFYAGLFPDTRLDAVDRALTDFPGGKAGDALQVRFTLLGAKAVALNGGPTFTPTIATSFQVFTADQAETDLYYDGIVAAGGTASPCSWCQDRFGFSWQIIPKPFVRMLESEDKEGARRATEAMYGMRKLDLAALEAAFKGEAA